MLKKWLQVIITIAFFLTFTEKVLATVSSLECNKEYSESCLGTGSIKEEHVTPVCRIWCQITLREPTQIERCPQKCQTFSEMDNQCKTNPGTLIREFLTSNTTPCLASKNDIDECKTRAEKNSRVLKYKCVK